MYAHTTHNKTEITAEVGNIQTSLYRCLGLRVRFEIYESHYDILDFGMSVCQLNHEAVYGVSNRLTFLCTCYEHTCS